MRIAHVTPALVTGGAQMMLAKLLEAGTDPADQLVIALRPGGGLWERVAATGARVEHLGLAAGASFAVFGHGWSSGVRGTPSAVPSCCRARRAKGRSTSTSSPSARASWRSFSPSPRVWVKAS